MAGSDCQYLLLVEDDELVRDTLSMMLEEEGFNVIEASSAAEAVRLIREGLEIPLIVTDVDLGTGASGIELADTLHCMQPNLRVIFITGRTASLGNRARDDREAVLPKPFESAELSRLVRRMTMPR
jgi:DNA-binding NtrC family response regulator